MRILIGWDNETELDLIGLYLGASDNEVVSTTDAAGLLQHAETQPAWDVVLVTTTLLDQDPETDLFRQLGQLLPDCPIVGACHTQDVFHMARYLTRGMRNYVLRDTAGDYVFLLQAMLQNAVEAVIAERERKVSEKLREEIDSVRKLQESMIPKHTAAPPGYRIVARYEPSQLTVMGGRPVIMAGGDYWDVATINDTTAVLLVGDASGHGMKACMSIMTMQMLVTMMRGSKYRETAEFVAEVNRQLCRQTIISEGGFITMLYGTLETDQHELHWSSAGHPVPLLQDLETNEVRELDGGDLGGMPLGIYAEGEYETRVTAIPPRSRLLFYTDGIIEAFPESTDGHAEFGLQGVISTLRRCRQLPLEDTLQALFDDSLAFTKGAGRHDDTSVVLLERD